MTPKGRRERSGHPASSSRRSVLLNSPSLRLCLESVEGITINTGQVGTTFGVNLNKLPPAHFLIFEDGKVSVKPYWQIDFKTKHKLSEPGAIDRIRHLLKESVSMRLISDVPLGVFLSGGVDSSIVVSLMARLMSEPVKTFSIGFEDETLNELPKARAVANHFKTDHREFVVKVDALDVISRLVRHYGEPYADWSAIPTYYVSKMASQHVTVALSGEGGDETFGGYIKYAWQSVAERWRRIPRAVRWPLETILSFYPEVLPYGENLHKLKQRVQLSNLQRHLRWSSCFYPGLLETLCTDDFLKQTSRGNEWRGRIEALVDSGVAGTDKYLYTDTLTYLPDDLLVKVDIASMANSLEVRCPFLDHRIVEFAASLPAWMKVKGTRLKYILKKAFEVDFPPGHLELYKQGFGPPVGKWLRNELPDLLFDTVCSDRALQRGYFRPEVVKRYVSEHIRDDGDHGQRLYALMMLELWHREFMDG